MASGIKRRQLENLIELESVLAEGTDDWGSPLAAETRREFEDGVRALRRALGLAPDEAITAQTWEKI